MRGGGEGIIQHSYSYSNPINYTDPSGLIAIEEARDAWELIGKLKVTYNIIIDIDFGWTGTLRGDDSGVPLFIGYGSADQIHLIQLDCLKWVEGDWKTLDELTTVQEALRDISTDLGGVSKFRAAMGRTLIIRDKEFGDNFGVNFVDRVYLYDSAFTTNTQLYQGQAWTKYTLAHELGHRWDARHFFQISAAMRSKVTTRTCQTLPSYSFGWSIYCFDSYIEPPADIGDHYVADEDPFIKQSQEDWAEAFAAFVYPEYPPLNELGGIPLGPIRKEFIEEQIAKLN